MVAQFDDIIVYTPKDIAEKLQMDIRTIRRYIKEGKLKGALIGKGYRVRKENLEEFLDVGIPRQPRQSISAGRR